MQNYVFEKMNFRAKVALICSRETRLMVGGLLRKKDLRTGTHLRCYPSYAFGAGTSRSRSHGRLRRPKTLFPSGSLAKVGRFRQSEFYQNAFCHTSTLANLAFFRQNRKSSHTQSRPFLGTLDNLYFTEIPSPV